MSPESPRFRTMRFGFADRTVYRSVPTTPRVGDLAWQEHQLAVLALQTVKGAIGDGRREELGANQGDWIVLREWHYLPDCTHGFGPDGDCERHSILTYAERAAAQALYEAPLDVGREGLAGFAAGQAEEAILALRLAGFPIAGASPTATDRDRVHWLATDALLHRSARQSIDEHVERRARLIALLSVSMGTSVASMVELERRQAVAELIVARLEDADWFTRAAMREYLAVLGAANDAAEPADPDADPS